MSKRTNINDLIYGDRAYARSYKGKKFGGSLYDDSYYGAEESDKSFYSSRCYEKHPPLKLPGTELVIYGGSCLNPVVKDADVYIGFDSGMKLTPASYPWNKGHEFLFRIRDMGVPQQPAEFVKLVTWVRQQLEQGAKVHCGCIGGHGRTGTFLAALVSDFGEPNAISYVRKNYCTKAVESREQTEFLVKHFGVKVAAGSKTSRGSVTSFSNAKKAKPGAKLATVVPRKGEVFEPVPNGLASIWGRAVSSN